MSKVRYYTCEICKTKPDQISHHKSHLQTEKHNDKKELLKAKLENLSKEKIQELYNISDIDEIISNMETKMEKPSNKLTDEEQAMIDASNNITNREALKDKIHEIHNYMRNNGVGYGMNALKVFNILYGLKKIEENNLLNKVDLKRPECEFSYLLKLANDGKDEKLASIIYNEALDSIFNGKLRNMLYYDIPRNIKSIVFAHLIKEIDKLSSIEKACNVQLSGKIYEYFIGRDKTAISELGAYFTERHIIDYILHLIGPCLVDGYVQSMGDPFGGSGGFTNGYITYLHNNNDINWKDNIKYIYHYDINEDVIKTACLETFCITSEIPIIDNFKYKNAFTDEFDNMVFKYIMTNPPYGGDKNVKNDIQKKQEKIKKYIKIELDKLNKSKKDNPNDEIEVTINKRTTQLKNIEIAEKANKIEMENQKVQLSSCSKRIQKYAKEHKLTGKDKEACSLILMMSLLDINGKCVGVLKEGVFFNSKYKNLRECLVKNFNVQKIISIPNDQFENTSTKTSIIIFENSEIKTTKINFYNLIVEKYEEDKFEELNDNIILSENKGDIKNISDILVSSATLEELEKNNYSFSGKKYKLQENKPVKGFKLVKLGDICEFLPKSKQSASDGKETGLYNFYTSSDNIKKCDKYDYENEAIIIGTGGNSSIHIDEKFSCSADSLIIKCNNKKINNKYLFYIIKSLWIQLISQMNGSTIKHITKEILKNFTIPIPKSDELLNKIINKISEPFDEKNKKQIKLKKTEEKIQNKITEIIENEECNESLLGDICNIKCGSNLPKDIAIRGDYQVYGGGESSYTHNIYNCDGFTILVSRVGNNGISLLNEKFYLTDNGFVLENDNINLKKFIGYQLWTNKNSLIDISNGSAQKVISKSQLMKVKIQIPKHKKIIKTELQPFFDKAEKLQTEIKNADALFKQYIVNLNTETIKL